MKILLPIVRIHAHTNTHKQKDINTMLNNTNMKNALWMEGVEDKTITLTFYTLLDDNSSCLYEKWEIITSICCFTHNGLFKGWKTPFH